MHYKKVKDNLEILIHYNQYIYQHIKTILYQLRLLKYPRNFESYLERYSELLSPQREEFQKQLIGELEKTIAELKDAEINPSYLVKFTRRVWVLIKKFYPFDRVFLEKELKEDLHTMVSSLNLLLKRINELQLNLDKTKIWMKNPTTASEAIIPFIDKYAELYQEFEYIEKNFIKILQKEVYREEFIEHFDDLIFKYWLTRIHDRAGWLYHGTSILFLRNIQIHGLDNSKISKGIKRAIETISKIYKEYSIDYKSANIALDVDADLAKRQISLTSRRDVVEAARTANLPAFLYELLDESNLKEEIKNHLLRVLPEEEKFMVRSIWRFGRILRKKNKPIVLAVKVDSNFLNYYGMPDFINDYNIFLKTFIEPYHLRIASGEFSNYNLENILSNIPIMRMTIGELIIILVGGKEGPASHAGIEYPDKLTEFFSEGTTTNWGYRFYPKEIRLTKVPQEFIYVKVAGKLVPISKVNERMIPFVE